MPDVYALSATFAPRPGTAPATVLMRALDAWVRSAGREVELPPIVPGAGWARRTADGGIVRWEVFEDGATARGRALYELTWRHPHAFVESPYAPTSDARAVEWSSRVSCVVGPDGQAALAVRVANTGPPLNAPDVFGTTRPRFLLDLARMGTLTADGVACTTEPRALTGVELVDLVRYDLLDPVRRAPVVLISPDADGRYPIPPATLGAQFFTLARVYAVATPDDTFALTDALGRRELSAFLGAMRVYLPGLSRGSDPLKHPLIVARRLTQPAVRHALATYLALRTPERFDDDPRFAALRDERAAHEDTRRREVEGDLARAAAAARGAADYQGLAELYSQENERLKAEADGLRARVADMDDEQRRLLYLLRQRSGDAAAEGDAGAGDAPALPQPETLADAVDQAAALFADHLCFLPNARKAAEASPYGDAAGALAVLQALAGVAARRAAPGGLGQPLREACAAAGLEYRPTISGTTSKKLRRQYEIAGGDGREHFCAEHLVVGTSYNPEHCLRVYFTSKTAGEPRFVVGHVGRHLDVETTT